jgi:hypothetical protein
MKNLIRRIIAGENLDEVYDFVMKSLFSKGPEDMTNMEILSYLSRYDHERFELRIDEILEGMAIFYKNTQDYAPSTIQELIMRNYKSAIYERYEKNYTPVQADIIEGIRNNDAYSFSAPTSTGKSFVIMNIIKHRTDDVVVVVPSRALINEYYINLTQEIDDNGVNILTFIDKINTDHSYRNIFIVTPERCRELFQQADYFNIGLFLFDEAQLSDETSQRGLLFDSIVRRCKRKFPEAKFVFAHPFVDNPEAQLEKNHLVSDHSMGLSYTQRNVGQIYMFKDDDWHFFHFGGNRDIMGATRVACDFDPIVETINREDGCVLFYVSKNSIVEGTYLERFQRYVDMCEPIDDEEAHEIISKLEEFTGGKTDEAQDYYSDFISLMRKGIVIHHGSMPMKTRYLIEEYVKKGYCKLCFATATLEQGINMPFDVVYLDRLEAKRDLSVKNLIGRAGRSTRDRKFDYGYVIVHSPANVSTLRKILYSENIIKNVSSIDIEDELDEDYGDFKQAIRNGTINDEYNMTSGELEKLKAIEVRGIIDDIINSLFFGDRLYNYRVLSTERRLFKIIIDGFAKIYQIYLGRTMEVGELNVLRSAIQIMLYKIYGKTFRNICYMRYNYVSKQKERKAMIRAGKDPSGLTTEFLSKYCEIPNKRLNEFIPLFNKGTKAIDVDYDRIIYDTYDYLDKLVNFKLTEVFFASLKEYGDESGNPLIKRLALLVRFGTDNEKEIWLLRYGLSFEDIEVIEPHVEYIDETGIVFKDSINELSEDEIMIIKRFVN